MAGSTYLPSKEGELVTWSANMNSLIGADPTIYGLTLGQATDFATLQSAYATAFTTANNDSTRTPSAIVAKNDAKEALINGPGGIRELVDIIQAYPGTTNEMRSDLQITIRDVEPTPIDPPSTAPVLQVTEVWGRQITVRIKISSESESRGKPTGVAGATVLRAVGENPPPGPSGWEFVGSTTRTKYTFTMPEAIEPGTKVWVTAFWFNPRAQSGPGATPVWTMTNNAGLSQAA